MMLMVMLLMSLVMLMVMETILETKAPVAILFEKSTRRSRGRIASINAAVVHAVGLVCPVDMSTGHRAVARVIPREPVVGEPPYVGGGRMRKRKMDGEGIVLWLMKLLLLLLWLLLWLLDGRMTWKGGGGCVCN